MTLEDARLGDRNNREVATASPVKISIVGVGGGGSNAVDNMIAAKVQVDDFIAINTDLQALRLSKATHRIQIGGKRTKGQGAGSNYEIGQQAAEESREQLAEYIKDSDLIFITAGMGGGTGTGAAPVIAQIAKEQEKLVVAFVTTPFPFERAVRMRNAEIGIANMRKYVDSIIIVPNEMLADVTANMTMEEAFRYCDDVLCQGVHAVTDIIRHTGRINVDFADISAVLRNGGDAFMGIGRASGEKRAMEAVSRAVNNKILNTSIEGASSIIINVEGANVTMEEMTRASNLITEVCSSNVNVINGFSIVPELDNDIQITIIATGFKKNIPSVPQQEQIQEQPANNDVKQPLNNRLQVFGTQQQTQQYAQQYGSQYGGQPMQPQEQSQPYTQQHMQQQFAQPYGVPPVQQPTQQNVRKSSNIVSIDEDDEDDWYKWLRKK